MALVSKPMELKLPIVIYAGPSLNSNSTSLIKEKSLDLRPPIKRHDIPELLSEGFEGTIVIVDGVFHQNLALGHAELRNALEKGIQIFGLSSIGAIRAYEMRFLGMKGYGKVFNYFMNEDDFQDDEVALKYFPLPPYTEMSEPLVHFRVCIDYLIETKRITDEHGVEIISNLKSRYFGDRTMKLFLNLLSQYSNEFAEFVRDDFDRFRIKKIDLVNFLKNEI